jgi:hypothetical protein
MFAEEEEITNPLSGNDEDDVGEQRKSALSHRSAGSVHHREVCLSVYFYRFIFCYVFVESKIEDLSGVESISSFIDWILLFT